MPDEYYIQKCRRQASQIILLQQACSNYKRTIEMKDKLLEHNAELIDMLQAQLDELHNILRRLPKPIKWLIERTIL